MAILTKTSDFRLLDKMAIGLSAACLVQCLALPVSIFLLPLLSLNPALHVVFHLALLVVVVPLSLIAFGQGWRRHGSRRVVALGGTGLVLLITAAVLGHSVLGTAGEALLTSAGGVLLIAAHSFNIRMSRRPAAA